MSLQKKAADANLTFDEMEKRENEKQREKETRKRARRRELRRVVAVEGEDSNHTIGAQSRHQRGRTPALANFTGQIVGAATRLLT